MIRIYVKISIFLTIFFCGHIHHVYAIQAATTSTLETQIQTIQKTLQEPNRPIVGINSKLEAINPILRYLSTTEITPKESADIAQNFITYIAQPAQKDTTLTKEQITSVKLSLANIQNGLALQENAIKKRKNNSEQSISQTVNKLQKEVTAIFQSFDTTLKKLEKEAVGPITLSNEIFTAPIDLENTNEAQLITTAITQAKERNRPVWSNDPLQNTKNKAFTPIISYISSNNISAKKAVELADEYHSLVISPSLTHKDFTAAQLAEMNNNIATLLQGLGIQKNTLQLNTSDTNYRQNITAIEKIQSQLLHAQKQTEALQQKQSILENQLLALQQNPQVQEKLIGAQKIIQNIDKDILSSSRSQVLQFLEQITPFIQTSQDKKTALSLISTAATKMPEYRKEVSQLEQTIKKINTASVIQTPSKPSGKTSPLQIPTPSQRQTKKTAQTQTIPLVKPTSIPLALPPQSSIPMAIQSSPSKIDPKALSKPTLNIPLAMPIAEKNKIDTITQPPTETTSTPSIPAGMPIAKEEPIDKKQTIEALKQAITIEDRIKSIKNALAIISKLNQQKNTRSIKQISSLVQQAVTTLFNNRSSSKLQELSLIIECFHDIQKHEMLKKSLPQKYIATLEALKFIKEIKSKTNALEQLELITKNATIISQHVDNYEKKLYTDLIETLFSSRGSFNKHQLEQFAALFPNLTTSKNIFDKRTLQRLTTIHTTLPATIKLFFPEQQNDYRGLIAYYQAIIKDITADIADLERNRLLQQTIPALINNRGNLTAKDIPTLLTLMNVLTSSKNLRLTSTQHKTYQTTMRELQKAIKITTDEKTYLQALIEKANAERNATLFRQALALFTFHTDAKIRQVFIQALKNLYASRHNKPAINPQAFLQLLQAVDSKKITDTITFLSGTQQNEIHSWIQTIRQENNIS